MSAQRARPAVPAEHRSAHPSIPGVPWWGAVLIAVVATALGFAFDAGSGDKQLSSAFSALYVLGCVVAVLAVRRSGVFTAVIQPPLLLFVVVPGAYFLMHNSEITGVKDILINCGYPLIERFPLMFFTTAAVLLVGLGRWFSGRKAPAADAAEAPARSETRRSGGVASTFAALRNRGTDNAESAGDEETVAPRRRHSADRRRARTAAASRAERPARSGRTGTRDAAPSRSRHGRPPAETELIPPVTDERSREERRATDERSREERRATDERSREERRADEPREERRADEPRRRRPRNPDERSRQERRSPELDDRDRDRGRNGSEPRRRTRTSPERDRTAAGERRSAADRADRAARRERSDRPDRLDRERPRRERTDRDRTPRPDRERVARPERRQESYDPFELYGARGGETHHPVSRVRYRGAEDDEPRGRRRSPSDADRWEYDI